ncbi:MAG: hypothetical protein JWN82_601 [Candidatus Saccharibacteria bacterium]|nr:hypothetical protein [Candidatus Saccharibacteria bacterium]
MARGPKNEQSPDSEDNSLGHIPESPAQRLHRLGHRAMFGYLGFGPLGIGKYPNDAPGLHPGWDFTTKEFKTENYQTPLVPPDAATEQAA